MEQKEAIRHLLIVSPSLKAGGIERALTVLANEFVKNGLKVSFIACLPGESHYEIDSRVNLIPSRIAYRNKSDKLFFYLRLLHFLRKQTNKIQPDAILSFGDIFNPLVLLSLYGLEYPVFISDRTSPNFPIHPLARLLKKWLYPRAFGIIAQTERAAKAQKKSYGRDLNIRIIPNAIQLIKESNLLKREKRILYVGRLSWEKGVDRLIKAFSLIENKDGWSLDIVGIGPQKEKLMQLAEDLDILDRVSFQGLAKDPTPFYLRAAIFVLPSHVEGFPNALCEAMSADLAVVCFDSIPYEEIIKPDFSGCVVKNNNIEELSRVLNQLMHKPDFRIKIANNAKSVIQRLDKKIISRTYLDFINGHEQVL